ncbi:phosphate/phosphite/phosphonate ABC transporter substrate-binding protein [Pseudohalocynthiibacter aestuariivivens]|jgi:ABC-type phosphate/phosphonate transport system substrate-binding protein|uniref:Phosphate/phosphite/phosphonate ABC transporter substrate-binding protein n=1 Tax=Pseudohalocynthiibacter aestuariivivens TaxID=1591409 RepID=A0ABV5JES8_9RHOB|nr:MULTISPECIES: PhnD/SsuA/transferrin family substrate-binding protein [Pseudohalocynthiibacter]MBS9718395.1 PhnD/SsuA/transferrin family substrate-binding protein [Pseudohalocynthiibacter aestuariivivens]MCK0103404.1 phosphate/phosphite/phosphonate ABC transporter substrate-binding protein [Pseudohalocynthiibacter sp. F2068]
MIAHFGMYDRAETAEANNRLWSAIRTQLGYGPDTLTCDGDFFEIWQNPDLLLSQTCGYPYRARLHGHVTLVGTPDYGLADCPAGYYNSVFVARADDPRSELKDFNGACLAYNDALSQSGWAAPRVYCDANGISLGSLFQSGAHAASARAVHEGQADFAALDAITWSMIERWDPFAKDLRVLAHTPCTPGLPLISAKGADKAKLFNAIASAIEDITQQDRDTLSIYGFVDIPAELYLAIENPPSP